MTIEKGEAWGRPATGPPDTEVDNDAVVARLVHRLLEEGDADAAPLRLAVRRGDLRRNLGLADVERGAPVVRDEPLDLPHDLGLVTLDDGRIVPFAAHLVVRRSRWAGPFVVVANVGWVGPWYVAPKAHPNDGVLDVLHGRLRPRQRWEARRRVITGSHLPHPELTTARVRSWEHELDRPTTIRADGIEVGTSRRLVVRVRADSFVVVV